MTNPYDKNKAISADEAAKIIPRAEFRVFGKNIIAGVQVCLTLRLKSEKHRKAMKSFSLAANLNSQLNGKSWAKSSSISKLRLN